MNNRPETPLSNAWESSPTGTSYAALETPERTVSEMRERARMGLSHGAVTADFGIEPKIVVAMLNAALATEIVCYLRYRRHYYMAEGIKAKVASTEFAEHARQEQAHADALSKRIVELGGEPDFDPSSLTKRSHAEYGVGRSLKEMIEDDLVAERVAIESYRGMVRHLSDRDPTTRRLLEEILAVEEERADDMHSLLKGLF